MPFWPSALRQSRPTPLWLGADGPSSGPSCWDIGAPVEHPAERINVDPADNAGHESAVTADAGQ